MRRRLLLLLTAAALVVAVAAPAAQANLRGPIRLKTGTHDTRGQAVARGYIKFVGDGPPYHRVIINTTLDDLCPGDGYSAVLVIQYQFSGGVHRDKTIVDHDGCAAAARRVYEDWRFKRALSAVGLVLEEVSHDANGFPTRVGDRDSHVYYPLT